MKTFYQLLANTTIASLTNMTVWFAIIFFSYLQTKSVLATSIMSGVYLISVAFTGFWFGGLVDHHKKRTLMIVSSAISLVIYIVAFFIYINEDSNTFTDISKPVFWIFVIMLLLAVIAGNIRNIALPTLIPLLVKEKELEKANGLAGTAAGISFFVVSIISAFLVGASGMYFVLILAIVLTLATLVHLFIIKVPQDVVSEATTTEEINRRKIDIKGTIKIIRNIPGLASLIIFTTINNLLGGVFMSLMDAYGLSLISVEAWGVLWAVLSTAFIFGGILITKRGLGANPLRTLFIANIIIWSVSSVFTLQSSILLLAVGMFIYLASAPFIEASEHLIIQKVVPQGRLGRVFGIAQSVEQSASPITAFIIGPLTQFIFIPFMTTGKGAELIGSWYGTGPERGIALVFTTTGILGLIITVLAFRSGFFKRLSKRYMELKDLPLAEEK